MQFSLSAQAGLEKQLDVSFPLNEIDQEVNKRLSELQRNAQLPGFRPGKIPYELIKKRFLDPVRAEILEEKVKESLQKAFQEEKIEPVAAPTIEVTSPDLSDIFSYRASFEIYPTIELADLGQVEIKRPVAKIEEADIARMLDQMRGQKATFVPVKRPSQLQDQVTIDFEGKVAGEVFTGGSAKDFKLILGSKNTIPGFEEGMVGKNVGETFEVQVSFPQNYGAKELAGKNAVFEIHLHDVAEPKLPELDDEFAKSFDITEGGVEGLRKQVIQTMEKIAANITNTQIKEQVLSQLVKLHQFDLPKALLDNEIQRMMQQQSGSDQHHHDHDHDHDHDHEHCDHDHSHDHAPKMDEQELSALRDQAAEHVKLGLLVRRMMEHYRLQIDAAQFEQRLNEIAQQYVSPEMMKKYLRSDQKLLTQIQGECLEDLLVSKVVEFAKVVDEQISYSDLLERK